MIWFWIDTGYACGGIATNHDGIVVDAAPIFRARTMGRPLNDFVLWARRRGVCRWERLP